MACRGVHAESCGDEESSSFSFGTFGEVLSCADANGVLTWLKLVGEPRADSFWKRFSFIP